MRRRYDSAPPDLLALLGRHRVRWVMASSVAAMLHGVDLSPGDLDVVPEVAGRFADLRPRATLLSACGVDALRAIQRRA